MEPEQTTVRVAPPGAHGTGASQRPDPPMRNTLLSAISTLSARLLDVSPASALGLTSAMLAFWFAVPQLLRLRRTGSVAGLSLEGLANSTVSLLAWTAYGLAHASVWVVASSTVGLPAVVATLVIALRGGGRLRLGLPLVWTAVLALTAFADALTATALLDVVLGCSILWFVAPAAVTAWRSADVSGLAWQTWMLLAVEGLVFGLYGELAGIGADRVYGIASLTGATLVLSRLAVARLRPAPSPASSGRELDDTRPIASLAV